MSSGEVIKTQALQSSGVRLPVAAKLVAGLTKLMMLPEAIALNRRSMVLPAGIGAACAIGAKASVVVTARAKQGRFLIIGGFFLNQLLVNGGLPRGVMVSKGWSAKTTQICNN